MAVVIKVDEGFFVAPQIDASAIEELRAAGIVAIINNRVDGEEPEQPTAADASAAFERLGFRYHHLPVTMATLSPEIVERFRSAWQETEGPVLAYCRSGMRSMLLWALAEARYGTRSAAEILTKAEAAGFDLSSADKLLQQVAAMRRPGVELP